MPLGDSDDVIPCKMKCGRAAAPGLTPKGSSFDTCCRSCSRGEGHDAECDRRPKTAFRPLSRIPVPSPGGPSHSPRPSSRSPRPSSRSPRPSSRSPRPSSRSPRPLGELDDSDDDLDDNTDQVAKLSEQQVGTDAFCDEWYWGHADSTVEPPEGVSVATNTLLLPLKLLPNEKFYHQFAKYVFCPSYLDNKQKGKQFGEGCSFLGGTAFLRHADVKQKLERICTEHAEGSICRKNELGYLLLKSAAFPRTGCLGLGDPLEKKIKQRRWLEHLLKPSQLPDRNAWLREAKLFLLSMRQRGSFKVRKEVSSWWQRMLWKHILKIEMSEEESAAFVKFQMQWLQSAVAPFPNAAAEYMPRWVSSGKKVWCLSQIVKTQCTYLDKIFFALPKEVPAEDRENVAQSVLEMFVFAGGLSVPQTIHCSIAVLFTPELLRSPFSLSERNIEAFVYEVTRLFPAVQGFCFWRGDKREILSLNAALRDPAVWGPDANRFSLKDVELYRRQHVGFANHARGGGSYSKSCPGMDLTLNVCQAFLLAVSDWQAPRSADVGVDNQSQSASVYWRPVGTPKPTGVQGRWWKDFTLHIEDWLDGDQTGESLLRQMGPVDLARLLYDIKMSASNTDVLSHLLKKLGPKSGSDVSAKVSRFDTNTRMFFELTRRQFKDLCHRTDSNLRDKTDKKEYDRFYDLCFGGETETIQLPVKSDLKKAVRDGISDILTCVLSGNLVDDVTSENDVLTYDQRLAAIILCQLLFCREETESTPPHSSARVDSYLPKATHPFQDITTDAVQVAIATCGIGQIFLKRNTNDLLTEYGDVVCDVMALKDFEVRPAFERLGAIAVFKRTTGWLSRGLGEWKLTAIAWGHAGPLAVVRPGEKNWEHAKWVWRCSLVTLITAVNHLMWTHWMVANSFTSSIHETMGPDHPIRRALQVHTYKTLSVNHHSALALYPEKGMLHRMSPFPYEELRRIFATGAQAHIFQTWPQQYEKTDLPHEIKSNLPMFEDGLEVWGALLKFYTGYVGLYYGSDEEVTQDAELQEYWKFTRVPQYARALPPLSKANLINQMTRAVFDVTAMHKFAGMVVAYTTDPAGAALQVRPGRDMADLQQLVQVNSLVAGTGMPMPMLVPSGQAGDEDWADQLDITDAGRDPAIFRKVRHLYDELMEGLRNISARVRKRNASGSRAHPFCQMDPLMFERSLSL
eukprot:TRINITY_DN11429_c0_g1_i1.p1 TRINITY_DN11429_c0_g1~~TRINITY_DN11429_c0_g1_i1.p1  ORF type:complete len:1192 (-),score=142.78 TRINITY_DN11429_c0_g1_i1:30-3605(-)